MSLTTIKLEKFRGFSSASIQLKPLTVLVGPNSSGKSSFSHALAALAHAHRLYSETPGLTLTPPTNNADLWPVDLGRLDDLRKAGSDGRVYITIGTTAGEVRWGFGFDAKDQRKRTLDITSVDQLAGSDVPHTSSEAGTLLRESPAVDAGSFPIAPFQVETTGDRHVFEKLNEQEWMELPSREKSYVDLRGLSLVAAAHHGGTPVQVDVGLRDEVRSIFGSLTYLRAIRMRPARFYESWRPFHGLAMGYSGEGFPDLLRERGDLPIVYPAPPVETPVQVAERTYLESHWSDARGSLVAALTTWLNYLGLAHSITAEPNPNAPRTLQVRIAVKPGESHDITEVGFGLSQVLPILVNGLLQQEDSLSIVDLPEAHLHPRPQALVADFFCGLARMNRRTLVETHSEMFVNQLRLRAEMDPLLREKIAVYVLDENSDTEPLLVGLGEPDQFRWPKGFLEEAWDIESKILNIRIASQFR